MINRKEFEKNLVPEYVTTCVGAMDLRSISNRLRDMAAVLGAHGLTEVAAHLVSAYGTLRGRLESPGTGPSAS